LVFRVYGLELRVYGSGVEGWGLEFGVQGAGCRVES